MIKGTAIVILFGAVFGAAAGIGGYTFVYAKGGCESIDFSRKGQMAMRPGAGKVQSAP